MAAKSLGTLTIDLIAKTSGFSEGMTKAERGSEKWKKQVKNDAKEVATALGAIGLAAGAATIAAVASTVQLSKEINNLAMLSGIGAQEFQKYAAGAKALEIEQEKLADIFKDTSDKVGDFLQTGGGPLADYFDQIAPKVGQTAEQFRNLSGPQALELYVKGLEEANLSQNEMIFFMEAIASDATLLLPLLKDNAAGFNFFGEEALKAGAILDSKTIKSAQELNAALFLMEQSGQGVKNSITSDLIPTISDLAALFHESTSGSQDYSIATDAINFTLKALISTAVGAAGAFDLLGNAIARDMMVIASIPDGFDAVQKALEMGDEQIEKTAEKYSIALEKIWAAGRGGDTNETVERIAAIQSALAGGGGVPGEEGGGDLDIKKRELLEANLEALKESFLTEREVVIAKYEEDRAILREALEEEKLIKDEFDELTIKNKQRVEKKLTDIQNKEAKARLKATQSALGDLSSLMNTESRKAFEVGKAAALANAVIAGYEAAVHSYNAGAKIGGPPVGAAFAAASIAATAGQISAINGTSFGGGSSGGGSSATASVNAAAEQVEPQNAQPEQNVFVKGIGKDDIFTGAQLVDLLNNELINGGRLQIE
jgi:hypothetical protein